jgi:glycosyltransferase involved in cell wall biosynthesis
MANEVACVVTAEGALPEIVGDAGIVAHSEEELLVALQELVVTPERRIALGQAARRRVLDRFVDAAVARGLDAFWRTALSGNPVPRE